MPRLHRTLHCLTSVSTSLSDNLPVLAQHAEEASVFLCRCCFRLFSCTWQCPSPHRCILQPTRIPLSGGCLALKPFYPHYFWPSCPTYVGCPGAISILPHHELLYKRKERRFLPRLKAVGIRAKKYHESVNHPILVLRIILLLPQYIMLWRPAQAALDRSNVPSLPAKASLDRAATLSQTPYRG